MPDIFQSLRYGQGRRDDGGDDWASRGTYRWLERNAGLITRINDISGEHGRYIGHFTHRRGTDIDMFHVDWLGMTGITSNTTGESVYARLADHVVRAVNGETLARDQVSNWISPTRARFNDLLAVGPGDVDERIYAIGSQYTREVTRNGQRLIIQLNEGWAWD